MWKSKINKGFTLLDTMISLGIFTIIIFCGFSIHISKIKQKNYNDKLQYYTNCIEIAAGNLLVNYKYTDLLEYKDDGVCYIDAEDINIDTLRSGNILALLKSMNSNMNKYISVTITGDEVLKLSLQLKYDVNGRSGIINHEVYKGSYN